MYERGNAQKVTSNKGNSQQVKGHAQLKGRANAQNLWEGQCPKGNKHPRNLFFSLQENFHLKHNLTGVFIDSFAVFYPEDEGQQSNFTFYTDLLWQFAQNKPSFDFKTIEDILEENQVCQKENDCLNGIIQSRLAELENLFNATIENLIQVKIDLLKMHVTIIPEFLGNLGCSYPK